MKKQLAILLLFFSVINVWSQEKYTQESGKVTQHEISMTEFDQDKDAEAVILYDIGEYYFSTDDNYGFVLTMKKRSKIKILKEAGIKYANFEIPYYTGSGQGWETVDQISAITYNSENGQLNKTVLDPKSIFEEKVNDKVRLKKIALSDVREGSVIEINYTINTTYFMYMREWNFQHKIPVVFSQLKYRAIPYYEYSFILKGANRFDSFTSVADNKNLRFGSLEYREMIHTFVMKDMPAFKDEEFITSENDYMTSLNFQMAKVNSPRGGSKNIISTWTDISDDFIKDDKFGKYIKSAEKESKKILPQLAVEELSPVKKLETITQYVKHNYNWDGFYGKYSTQKVSDLIKKQTGNVADINLFLIGLLQSAGLETYPVALSTRKNGSISPDHPFQQFLNYVIAMVVIDGKIYFVDGTESLLYYDNLPERCLNVLGLVVKPKKEDWVTTKQSITAMTQKDFDININPEENKAEVKAAYTSIGQDAYFYRSVSLGKEDKLTKYLKDRNNIEVKDNMEIIDYEKTNKPFRFSFGFDNSLEGTPDKLFIHPFCNLSVKENPFKQTSRKLPVDLIYIRGEIYKSQITIPEGYKVEYLPKDFKTNDNQMSINYTVVQSDHKIVVSADYTFKQNLYDASRYNTLKMSMADVIKQFSEMIVLVKE